MSAEPTVHFEPPGSPVVCSSSNKNGRALFLHTTTKAWITTCGNCKRTDEWRKAMREAPEEALALTGRQS